MNYNMDSEQPIQDINTEGWLLLTEIGYPYADMLSDLLSQSGIPFVTRDRMGAGMALKVGPLSERTCFYVPRSHYQSAADLLLTFSQN